MRLVTKTDRLHARQFNIPTGARCILEHTNGSQLFTYERAGRFYAIAFWGTAGRAQWHYTFRTVEHRDRRIAEFKAAVETSVASKTQRSSEKASWTNPLKVGDILYTCWGYDQTNVEFYTVTKVSGRKTTIAQIASDFEGTGHMSGKTWPAMPIRITGPETSHLAQPSGVKGVYVKINKSVHAWLETGREHHTSSYA